MITIGERQARLLPAGDYAYVGSAMRGFKARLSHHLRPNKKPHWHIDYLLQKAVLKSIIICETEERVECAIAQAFQRQFESILGFGSSDCKCPSHLFWAADSMKEEIMTILKALGMQPRMAK